MKEKIYIVSEKRDMFYDISQLVPEMMKAERVTEDFAISYFMDGLEGSKIMKFPLETPTRVIYKWITQDMGLNIVYLGLDTH